MFGLEFLFGSALWLLPLAGVPVVLHLLFRRKAPVVPFSTLRFIRSSMQRTAARKRVQRWMLLACRILLLALLIWAIAQPARKIAAGWLGGASTSAAIVVDTSYSMELQDHQTSLLNRASDAVDQLLRENLANARVAIFRSAPSTAPEQFQSVPEIQANWRQLQSQPSPGPLVDRIAAAEEALNQQNSDQKWLIVLSDLQRHEFPRPIPDFPGGRIILLDLHPDDPRAAAVAAVHAQPPQPRLGLASQVAVDVTGRSRDARALNLSIASAQNPSTPLATPTLPMAQLDASGRTTVRIPYTFANESWLLLTASLQSPDALPWANSRTQLVRVPPREIAQVAPMPRPNPQADAIVRLALDPSQGEQAAWPISVAPPGPLKGNEDLVVANLTAWPDITVARQWTDYVRRGGTLALFIQPGLEQTWQSLPAAQQSALRQILPGTPIAPAEQGPFHGSIARPDDPLLEGMGDIQSASGKLQLDRIVPLDISDPSVQTLLSAGADRPTLGSRLRGLLMRRPLGSGQVYTWATFPTPLYGNLATYELFLPMLVNMAAPPPVVTDSYNVALGQRITLPPDLAGGAAGPLELVPPTGPAYQVTPSKAGYLSEPVDQPGLWTWQRGGKIVSYTNVQYPADEAILDYRPASEVAVPGPDVIVARSVAELQQKMQASSQPQAEWTMPIAIVLLLLCLEALMGSTSRLWKPIMPRFFVPKMPEPASAAP